MDALGLSEHYRALFEFTLEQLKDDIIPDDITLKQLPKRFECSGKTLALESTLIRNSEGVPDRVLVSLIDVTSL